jgi:3-oxoacyl-[acyl-carrier protein] reductase
METGLTGLNVLVTGASGGIGRALADAFAGEGCGLVLHAGRHLTELEQFVASRPWAERACCVAADLRDEAQTRALFRGGREALGRIDVAIVNAGIWPPEDLDLHEMSPERIRDVIDVNLLGAMWTCRAFMQGLAEAGPREDRRGPSLCLIGSTAGHFGEAGHVAYAVSKAGMYGLLRTLKTELARLDPYARINLVEPGWTATPMAREALDRPGLLQQAVRTMSLRQIARPEDIARACVFLSSPAAARHVTGEVVTVAGGMEGRTLWAPEAVDPAAIKARLDED